MYNYIGEYAEAMKVESKDRIGVIVPHISSNTETELIDVIYKKAAEYGYDVLVISGVINYVDDMLEGTIGLS